MTNTSTTPDRPAASTPRRHHRDPRTGRYVLAPAEAEARTARLAALHAEIEDAAKDGRLPPSVAALWREELAVVVDALRALTPNLAPTTAAGRVSRGYRDYVLLVDRAATLARWLGLGKQETSSTGKRPWSKLTREQQAAEAERSFRDAEAAFRRTAHDEDDDAVE